METDDDWAPAGIDPTKPSPARIYDYCLGGAHNFAVDRRVAEQTIAAYPEIKLMAQVNRAFLRRAVQYLVDRGIRQFLDIGSGIPTVGHVHEIAQATAPESRVVYVDIDPIAVTHSQQILAGNDHAIAVQQDLRNPEQVVNDPDVTSLIDVDRPVAVLLAFVLHFIPDREDPGDIVGRVIAPLAAGSHVAISHSTEDGTVDLGTGKDIYRRSGIEMAFRTHAEVIALFGDCELVSPGVVFAPAWHPESNDDPLHNEPARSANYVGVARKR